MKKLLSLLTLTVFVCMIACGPGREELDDAEKMRKDSVAKAAADSVIFAEKAKEEKAAADSLAVLQAALKAKEDSLAASAAKAKPKAKAKKTTHGKR